MTLWFLLWVAVTFGFNYPAIFADQYYLAKKRGDYKPHFDCPPISTPREDVAQAVLFAMIPVASTFVAIFGTGFCEHGLRWFPDRKVKQ